MWLRAGLVLVLAGAIGNLIDRAALGYVIDFISVHWREYYFPLLMLQMPRFRLALHA